MQPPSSCRTKFLGLTQCNSYISIIAWLSLLLHELAQNAESEQHFTLMRVDGDTASPGRRPGLEIPPLPLMHKCSLCIRIEGKRVSIAQDEQECKKWLSE